MKQSHERRGEPAPVFLPGQFTHYKGDAYEALSLAQHSETYEWMVVYRSLDSGHVYVRPHAMFVENVEVDGKMVPRFARIGDL